MKAWILLIVRQVWRDEKVKPDGKSGEAGRERGLVKRMCAYT